MSSEVLTFKEDYEVDGKLRAFDVTKKELQTIALQAISARNDATSLHPVNAPGTYAYLAGTAALRELFLQKDGWKMTRDNNIEAVENESLNLVLVFQNVHKACDLFQPKPISKKGEGSRKLVENSSLWLWEDMAIAEAERENKKVWFFCVSYSEEEVKAELSRPRIIQDGEFESFAERIFIITDNDWNPEDGNSVQIDAESQDFDINVTKKE